MSTAKIPTPLSYQAILGNQLNTVRARLGLKKFKPGGPFLTIFEAASQSDARNSADIFTALQTQDLDNAVGIVLDRIGNDERVPRRNKKAAIGEVTITDTAVTKMSSTLYHGKAAPIVGSIVVYVSKGSTFDTAPPSGAVYLGRGTSNYEGPLDYSLKADSGSFWTLTISSTTKFHNQGESVILAQGGSRPIQVGQTVSTAQGASTAPITYTTVQYATVPDGETEIDSIPIVCTVDGIAGNVPANSIVSFGNSTPFSTATVTNPVKIDFGRDIETDNDYRDRIRQARANKQRGTDSAIKNAVIDVSSPEETSSVLSANIVRRKDKPTVLYIDDGNGYEEKSRGVGFESVIDSATGGETDFLSIFSPIAQAYVEASNLAPYSIPDGASLTVRVGGVSQPHFFDTATFVTPLAASAYDVVSSINGDFSLPFQARVTQSGKSIAIFAKSEENDDLQVVAGLTPESDASVILGLSTAITYTTSLYKNDILLSKDGALAQIVSNHCNLWSTLLTSETIIISVDGTGDFTYTINDADFQALNYAALSNATPQVWAQVLTTKLPGITVTSETDRLILTSNKGKVSSASISITGGTLVSKGVFGIGASYGVSNDYSIDRSVGSIVIATHLNEYDRLSLGTQWPEAFIETDFDNSPIALLADSNYYLSVDDPAATIIPTSIFKNGQYSAALTSVSPNANFFQFIKTPNLPVGITGLKEGDWILLNDPAFDSFPLWKGIYRTNADTYPLLTKDSDTATRFAHTSTATNNSMVIVMGGLTSPQSGIGLPGALKGRCVTGKCSSYDPSTGAWTELPNMITPRAYHTATLLLDGNIFVVGGFDETGSPLASTEIFNTTTKTFSAGPTMATRRVHHSATLLQNGWVLIAGGWNASSVLKSCDRYIPLLNSFTPTTDMGTARYGHQSVNTSSDLVWVFGGISSVTDPAVPIATIERYDTGFNVWNSYGGTDMASPRAFFGAVYDSINNIAIVAGNMVRRNANNTKTTNASTGTFQVFDFGTSTWNAEKNFNNPNFPGITFEFAQNDLAISGTNKKITAGSVSVGTQDQPKILNYDYATNQWSYSTPGSTYIDHYLSSREASTSAAIISAGSLQDTVGWFGGVTSFISTSQSFSSISNTDLWDPFNLVKTHPYPTFSNIALSKGRIIAARSKFPPDIITIPFNTGYIYTADSFAPVMNIASTDMIADVYQTTKVRLATLSTDGSLLLLDQDADLPTFTPQKLVVSQRSQFATVSSSNELDIPSGFQLRTVGNKSVVTGSDVVQKIDVPDYSADFNSSHLPEPIPANGTVVGLKGYPFGGVHSNMYVYSLWNNAKNTKSIIGSFNSPGIFTEADLTTPSLNNTLGLKKELPLSVGNPVYIASPYRFSISDTLNITVDGDSSLKRFVIPMARKMATNSSYSSTLSLKDADNSNNTISKAFGIDYDFNDFAVLSRARTLSDSADASKRILWRYYRYGDEGNNAAVRYVYPTLPNQGITVSTSAVQSPNTLSYYKGQPKATVDVSIGSGTLRKNRTTTIDTRFGVSKAPSYNPSTGVSDIWVFTGFTVTLGSRPVNPGLTTLTISVPFGVNGVNGIPGIFSGDILYYKGNAPSSVTLNDGQFVVNTATNMGLGVWQITLASGVLNDSAPTSIWNEVNPGTISTDPSQKAYFDPEVLVGDLVSLTYPNLSGETMVIKNIDLNRQYIQCSGLDFTSTNSPTPSYRKLNKLTDLNIFAPPTNTATAIASAVNADSNSAVSATVTGTGLGIISSSSWFTNQYADSRNLLTDGVNYVRTTNKPANVTLPTTFDLKLPVNTTLVTSSDFSNEIFYLVPQLGKSIVNWLNTPAITGLWSVANIVSSNNNTAIQIRTKTPGNDGSIFVEGGSANLKTAAVVGNATASNFNTNLASGLVLTTTKAESEGFCGNSWVELDNTVALQKVTDSDNTPYKAPWGTNNNVTSITAKGVVTFTSSPYAIQPIQSSGGTAIFSVEKIGKYVGVSFFKAFHSVGPKELAKEGNWLYIKDFAGGVVPSNCGVFKILRFSQTESSWTYWIENPNVIESSYQTGYASNLSENSLIPGDILSINSEVFGTTNKKTWTIVDVGNGYTDSTVTLSIVDSAPTPFSGNTIPTTVKNVSVIEKIPNKGIKKLLCISPNKDNGNYADLLLDDNAPLYSWSQSAGTIVTALNKLGFPNTVQNGTDAYRYNSGLISETKRVIYGDSADVDNYPGYVADGARVLIQGPTIKRVSVTLQIKLQNNDPSIDTVGAVKSAVAGVINASPIGIPIAISDIISTVQAINGISAISIVSPTYNAVNDQIIIKGQEKAMVIDPDIDIQVLIAGN